jgi:hypothetical protein
MGTGWRPGPCLAPQWPAGAPVGAPRVFAYLKGDHSDHALVLQALVKLGCQVLCFMPEVAGGKPPPVRSPLIHYATGPVDLTAALPGCALCICHGGEATLARALLCEVPVLLLPMQAEQFLISRAVGRGGLGVNAAERRRPLDYAAVMQPMLAADGSFKQAATAFAQRHASFTSAQQTLGLVDEFERQLSLRRGTAFFGQQLRRRRATLPTTPRPPSISAHVPGSGTAVTADHVMPCTTPVGTTPLLVYLGAP